MCKCLLLIERTNQLKEYVNLYDTHLDKKIGIKKHINKVNMHREYMKIYLNLKRYTHI